MSPIIQTILWSTVGILGTVTLIKILSKRKKSDDPQKVITSETNQSAKDAFLKNVENFESILPQLNNSLNIESWTELIVEINNPELTVLWQRYLRNVNTWKKILSSWGLRQDSCKSFTYLDKYANMYETSDNKKAIVGSKYRVIDGCWILTNDSNGNKRVIKKGVIEKL